MSQIPAAADRWTAWDGFLEATPDTGFMQASWWADFRTTVGYEHFAAILKDRQAIVGGALVQKFAYGSHGSFYYIQDGPVLPGDQAIAATVLEAILEEIDQRRRADDRVVSHLRVEPRWERLPSFVSGFRMVPAFEDAYMEPRNTLCIDLRPPEASILAQMRPKGRYNIRVAQRHGVSVVEDQSDQGVKDFLRIYKRTAARQELDAKPSAYFRSLVSMLSSLRRAAIFFAEYQGMRLATALVVYFGRRATYFYGGSLARYRRVMAPCLLHFEIMRRAKARGLEWYDLWGVAPEDEPEHPWANISAFKRKFGGVEVHLVPTLDLVYDQVAYDEYAALFGKARPAVAEV